MNPSYDEVTLDQVCGRTQYPFQKRKQGHGVEENVTGRYKDKQEDDHVTTEALIRMIIHRPKNARNCQQLKEAKEDPRGFRDSIVLQTP